MSCSIRGVCSKRGCCQIVDITTAGSGQLARLLIRADGAEVRCFTVISTVDWTLRQRMFSLFTMKSIGRSGIAAGFRMVRPMMGSTHADGWFGLVVSAHADGWFGPHFTEISYGCFSPRRNSKNGRFGLGRVIRPTLELASGRRSSPAFAKAPFWQFHSQMATELITEVLKPIRTNRFTCVFCDIQPTLGRQETEEMCSK